MASQSPRSFVASWGLHITSFTSLIVMIGSLLTFFDFMHKNDALILELQIKQAYTENSIKLLTSEALLNNASVMIAINKSAERQILAMKFLNSDQNKALKELAATIRARLTRMEKRAERRDPN